VSVAAREAQLRTPSVARAAVPANIKEGRPNRAIIQDIKRDKPTLQQSMSEAALRRGGRQKSEAKAAQAPVKADLLKSGRNRVSKAAQQIKRSSSASSPPSITGTRSRAANRSAIAQKIAQIANAKGQAGLSASKKAEGSAA
jgi:hypothetical protein